MIRSGSPSLILVTMFPMTSVRMKPRPTPSRWPDRSVMTFLRRSVSLYPDRCVSLYLIKCSNQPLTKCQDVPTQKCHSEHKKFPVRVSRQQAKKVCDEGYTDSLPASEPGVQLPEVIVSRNKNKLQTDSKKIVFGDK